MSRHRLAVLLAVLTCAPAVAQSPLDGLTPRDLDRGKLLFEAQCSRCHGFSGRGGSGPSLTRRVLRRAPDDETLIRVIAQGIPDTPMPESWQMSDRERRLVAGYVRALGRVAEAPVRGDATRGRAVYETAGCPTCHVVGGEGGSFGPDLTDVGDRRGVEHLRDALVKPAAVLPEANDGSRYLAYLPVAATTREGRQVDGVRVNEDSFTIQLRAVDGEIISLDKSALTNLDKRFGTSAMPAYDGMLSGDELEDLVAWLASLRGAK